MLLFIISLCCFRCIQIHSLFQIHSALELCSDYMISLLTFSNSEELLSVADTFSLQRVTQHYKEKVLRSFAEFAASEAFLRLTADQLAAYMADDHLQVPVLHMFYSDANRIVFNSYMILCIIMVKVSRVSMILYYVHV